MYTVFIVDDEPIERQAMQMMIQSLSSEIQILGEAGNGFEAIKRIRDLRPDIVLLDIQMPGIDGLEVVEELIRLNIQVKVILITSHSTFEYARKALKLGVEDYLVKPTSIEDLEQTLSHILKELNRSREELGIKRENEAKMHDMQVLLRHDLIKHIEAGVYSKELPKILNLLNVRYISSCAFIFKGTNLSPSILDRLTVQIRRLGFTEFHDSKEEYSLIIIINELESRSMNQRSLCDYMISYLNSQGIYEFSIHVGSLEKEPAALPLSFHKAFISSLRGGQRGTKGVFHYDEQTTLDEQSDRSLLGLIDTLTPMVLTGDMSEITRVLESNDTRVLMTDIHDNGKISRYYQQLIILIKHRISQDIPAYIVRHDDLAEGLFEQDHISYEDLKMEVQNQLATLIDTLREIKEAANNPLYKKVVRYLEENSMKNLSLESLAQEFHVSTYYVSKIVKLATNCSFSEFLTQLRIAKAKDMLRQGRMNVKEVSFAVGFNSQHYFSRIFKKYTGLSPSEYVKTC